MFQDKYVLSLLTAFQNRTQFNNYVRKYDGNLREAIHLLQSVTWYDVLTLSYRESLRDLIVTSEAHRAKQYHLGLGLNPIAKVTLAYANQNRDYRIFEDFAFYIIRKLAKSERPISWKFLGNKYAFDSTTIPLFLATFSWSKFRGKKRDIKTHILYDI